MNRLRLRLFTFLYAMTTRLAARRRPRTSTGDYARQDFRTQTRGMRLLGNSRFIDRMRPRWLRLRTDDE